MATYGMGSAIPCAPWYMYHGWGTTKKQAPWEPIILGCIFSPAPCDGGEPRPAPHMQFGATQVADTAGA